MVQTSSAVRFFNLAISARTAGACGVMNECTKSAPIGTASTLVTTCGSTSGASCSSTASSEAIEFRLCFVSRRNTGTDRMVGYAVTGSQVPYTTFP